MYPIEKSKIKIGMKAKARFRLTNRDKLNMKGAFIFIDCTVLALGRKFGRDYFVVKLHQPLFDVINKRTKEYKIVNNEANVSNLYA